MQNNVDRFPYYFLQSPRDVQTNNYLFEQTLKTLFSDVISTAPQFAVYGIYTGIYTQFKNLKSQTPSE